MFTRGTRATIHESVARQWIKKNSQEGGGFKLKMVFQRKRDKHEIEELKVSKAGSDKFQD